jgi:hypothetical protein
MKVLAILLLSLSFPGSHLVPAPHSPVDHPFTRQAHNGGKWYLAENGHAVYCYGPVMLLKQAEGGLQRVATFCKGERTMVPLRD